MEDDQPTGTGGNSNTVTDSGCILLSEILYELFGETLHSGQI